MNRIAKSLSELEDVSALELEPMARHTSLGVGGPADLFVRVRSESALAKVIAILEEGGCPWTVIGGGTNLLVTDDGIEGAVISLGGDFSKIEFVVAEGERRVVAGAAVPTARLLKELETAGAWGLEFLTGIPGTVGGAVCMNAGTRHGYVESALRQVRLLSLQGASWQPASALRLTYRGSSLPEKSLITAAAFAIRDGRPEEARRVVEDLETTRRTRHPPMAGTAGSFFKNPDIKKGLFAGRLIESAGLKGKRIGGALVSPIHANFLMNAGDAKASDLLELAAFVRAEVEKAFGVGLVPEVRIVGRGSDEWRRRLGAI